MKISFLSALKRVLSNSRVQRDPDAIANYCRIVFLRCQTSGIGNHLSLLRQKNQQYRSYRKAIESSSLSGEHRKKVEFKRFGFEPFITMNLLEEHYLEAMINLLFDKSDESRTKAAHECALQTFERFFNAGIHRNA